jgi:hypothetical protein
MTITTAPGARTKAGHAIGACPGCGFVLADTEQTRRRCPSCDTAVTLEWVYGQYSEVPCDGRCMGATRRMCECSCGGVNHGRGYLNVQMVPQWVRERDAARHQDKAARAEARRQAEQEQRNADRDALVARFPVLAWLSYRTNTGESVDDGDFMRDMAEAFSRGRMTDRQAAAAVRAIERDTERRVQRERQQADRDAAAAAGVTVPTGRQQVTGFIVSARYEHNRFGGGGQHKMLVQTDEGYRLWGTCPAALADQFLNSHAMRGARVQFTATIGPKPDGDDPLFGLFKRPTSATTLPAA